VPDVPFHCSSCGLTYPSNIAFDESSNVTLVGNVGMCPKCGARTQMAIPDGKYDFRGDQIILVRRLARGITRSGATHEDLQELKQLVQETLAGQRSLEAAVQEMQPQFAELAAAVQESAASIKTSGRKNYALVLLQVVLTLLLSRYPLGSAPPSANDIERVVREAVASEPDQPADTGPSPKTSAVKRPHPRNQRCYRGSGRKYKHCHGSLETAEPK